VSDIVSDVKVSRRRLGCLRPTAQHWLWRL